MNQTYKIKISVSGDNKRVSKKKKKQNAIQNHNINYRKIQNNKKKTTKYQNYAPIIYSVLNVK